MPIKIKKNEDKPESKEILAEAIIKISDGFMALIHSGLNREAIVTLLHHKTKVNRRDIDAVLTGLQRLKGWYCR